MMIKLELKLCTHSQKDFSVARELCTFLEESCVASFAYLCR